MIKKSRNRILKKLKKIIYKLISLSNIINIEIKKSIDLDFMYISIKCDKNIGLGLYKYLVGKNIEKEVMQNKMTWKYNYYDSIFTRGVIPPDNNTEFVISISAYYENNNEQLENLYKKLK